MAEYDYAIRDLVIKQKANFNLIELYNTLKEWFKFHGYTLFEKEYNDIIKGDRKNIAIKWEAKKEIDEYVSFSINVGIKISNYQIIKTKKENLISGNLKIEFESYKESDHGERWDKTILAKVIRGVYDKMINNKKYEKYEKELKNQTIEVFNKTKFFLNMYKFK